MSLTEALSKSRPLPPTQVMARKPYGKGSVAVASDGRFWDVHWPGGAPYGFAHQAEVEAFLEEQGVSLQEGWMPQVSTGSAVQC